MQQQPIGVVCVRNPGRRNLGMYSVDLSAARYFTGRGLPYQLLSFSGHRQVGSLRYEVITSVEAYRDYRDIVFWGDFQQNPLWGLRNHAPRLMRKEGRSHNKAVQEWRKRFLLEGVPSAEGQRRYSLGTCFLGVQEALEQAGLTAAEYADLLSRFTAIVPRDEVSYQELVKLGLTNISPGFDCASLLDLPPHQAQARGRFAYSFGRSLQPETGKALVSQFARVFKLKPVPVTWLLGKYQPKNLARAYEKALGILSGVEFLVTDIYHLTLNALNLGCPVYCIGREEETFDDTCDDYKKAVLMRMVGAGDEYFVLPEGTAEPVRELAASITTRRQAGTGTAPTYQAWKTRLRATLDQLWGVSGK